MAQHTASIPPEQVSERGQAVMRAWDAQPSYIAYYDCNGWQGTCPICGQQVTKLRPESFVVMTNIHVSLAHTRFEEYDPAAWYVEDGELCESEDREEE